MLERNRIQAEIDRADRVKRQTEGVLTGYSIKTKRYSNRDVNEDATNSNVEPAGDGDDASCDVNSDGGDPTDAPQDQSSGDHVMMCAICLLELEGNERVADLSCNHLYHAECLGEWVLKKNSCPLCQDPGVAKEVRTYETEGDAVGNTEDSLPGDLFSRMRRGIRNSLIDIATGRGEWTHRTDDGEQASVSTAGRTAET